MEMLSILSFRVRYLYLHLVAHLLVEQSLCDRGLDGNLSLPEVSLALADNGVGHLRIVGEIGHLHLGEDLYGIGAQA